VTDEIKAALQTIWEELPQEHINNIVKCLAACAAVAANGGHFKHSPTLHPPVIINKPALFRATNRLPVNTAQNAEKWGLSRLKHHNFVTFRDNLK